MLPGLPAGAPDLPGFLVFSSSWDQPDVSCSGRTILRPEPDGESPGAAVFRNPHPSCQLPGESNRPYIAAAPLHPGPNAPLGRGAQFSPDWLT